MQRQWRVEAAFKESLARKGQPGGQLLLPAVTNGPADYKANTILTNVCMTLWLRRRERSVMPRRFERLLRSCRQLTNVTSLRFACTLLLNDASEVPLCSRPRSWTDLSSMLSLSVETACPSVVLKLRVTAALGAVLSTAALVCWNQSWVLGKNP